MSAPDDSNSKAPPSLLSSDAGKGSGANHSRILANLEGRVSPQTENAPRSRKGPIALIALAVVAVSFTHLRAPETKADGGWGGGGG